MSPLPESILLEPGEEAARLWEGAQSAHARAGESLADLCAAIDLGIRAVEIRAVVRLQQARDQFPATIGAQLATPDPAIDPKRDATETPKVLSFVDLLDLMSGEDLGCVSLRLHTGWEDRRFSCKRSRVVAREQTGLSLDADEREQLLRLAAYHNRIFRLPPPVLVTPGEVMGAYPALVALYDKLSA